jgi:diguanylate cyclase (GGDEF)-like protein
MDDLKNNCGQGNTLVFKSIGKKQPKKDSKVAFLTVIRGGVTDLGLHKAIKNSLEIGRSEDCDLCLRDHGVSWRHAKVYLRGSNTYILEDLDSTNGTLVNGLDINGSYTLNEGDKIFTGETVIRFSLADEMDLGFLNQVSQLVGTDPLTGLESKRCFDDALDYELEVSRRQKQQLSVLMMDLDGVKTINDTHGHLFGAHVIGETGRIIANVLGDQGQACRFGGDEFTAFLPGHNKDQALIMAEKIRLTLESAHIEKNSIRLTPTISIGVATFSEDGEHVLQLVASADQALYRAKIAGKNKVST